MNKYSNGSVEIPFYVGNSYSFSSSDGLVEKIGAALSNSGFTEEEFRRL